MDHGLARSERRANIRVAQAGVQISFTVICKLVCMQFWTFAILDGNDTELGSGWVRAEDAQEALDMVGHDDTVAWRIPDDSGFPPDATGPVTWTWRHPSLFN